MLGLILYQADCVSDFSLVLSANIAFSWLQAQKLVRGGPAECFNKVNISFNIPSVRQNYFLIYLTFLSRVVPKFLVMW